MYNIIMCDVVSHLRLAVTEPKEQNTPPEPHPVPWITACVLHSSDQTQHAAE